MLLLNFTRRHCTRFEKRARPLRTVDEPQREGRGGEEAGQRERKGRGQNLHSTRRGGGSHKTEVGWWSATPLSLQTGSGGSSTGTAPSTQHRNTPHHVITALHRILTANQHYSTATQLRLVHKRYTRKRVRVIGKQLLQDRKKSKRFKEIMLWCQISKWYFFFLNLRQCTINFVFPHWEFYSNAGEV